MTGMERNSEVVQLAAYAPLLANVNHKGALCPTNLVIYDNSRCLAPCSTCLAVQFCVIGSELVVCPR